MTEKKYNIHPKWIPWGHDLVDGYLVPDQDAFDILFQAFDHLEECGLKDTARWVTEITGRNLAYTTLKKLKDQTYATRERPQRRKATPPHIKKVEAET